MFTLSGLIETLLDFYSDNLFVSESLYNLFITLTSGEPGADGIELLFSSESYWREDNLLFDRAYLSIRYLMTSSFVSISSLSLSLMKACGTSQDFCSI